MKVARRLMDHQAFWVQLGQQIRVQRRALKLSQRQLGTEFGERIGLQSSSGHVCLHLIERGARSVDAHELRVLANLLEVSVLELLP